MSEVYYMKVGKPPFSLPEAVADSVKELAQMTGVKAASIHSKLSHAKQGYPSRYIRIEVYDDDETKDEQVGII